MIPIRRFLFVAARPAAARLRPVAEGPPAPGVVPGSLRAGLTRRPGRRVEPDPVDDDGGESDLDPVG